MSIDLTEYATGLIQVEPGRWVAAETDASYPASGHSTCFAVENDSFWFRHRNDCILAMVRRTPPSGPIFDVGGGNGFVAKALHDNGFATVLVEPGEVGCENAKARGLPAVARSTARGAGFRSESLPAIGMFDVLEHIEDDKGMLLWLFDKLSPGGRLYLTVPAFQLLWSYEDVHAGHFRRYRRGVIVELLSAAGFRVDYASYIFLPLVLPILVLRSLPTRLGLRSDVSDRVTQTEHSPPGESLLTRLLNSERSRIERGAPAAFMGSSIIVSATKPQGR